MPTRLDLLTLLKGFNLRSPRLLNALLQRQSHDKHRTAQTLERTNFRLVQYPDQRRRIDRLETNYRLFIPSRCVYKQGKIIYATVQHNYLLT
jgi:hypothetical protein